jgi:hypothetical protein
MVLKASLFIIKTGIKQGLIMLKLLKFILETRVGVIKNNSWQIYLQMAWNKAIGKRVSSKKTE